MDVLYLKNAEVERFNGCGFCKWANSNPPARLAGYNNTGWPGCCRPPSLSEHALIQAADWRAVSIVHRVSIPPEIKIALDGLSQKGLLAQPTSIINRSSPAKSTTSVARRNSGATTPSKSNILSAKAMNTPIQGRGRNLQVTDGGANLSRSSSTSMISSSVSSSRDRSPATRRKFMAPTASERRSEATQSSQSSPSRKSTDIENPVSPRRVSSVRRPTVTPATTSVSVSKVVANSRSQSNQDASMKRRTSISGSADSSPSSPAIRNKDQVPSFIIPRISKNEDDCSASSSSGSSDGRSSLSDNTITSDGGFTDYLSDESEAELQRQAEEKAALFAQMQAEELEFKMARQQLAHVGLRPPKSWNPTNASSTPSSTNTFAPRNSVTTAPSFGAAAAVMVEGAQARG
ncbi:hypothetical protein BYT27DRAFT_7182776 [Phlegmacium glaucopus]|nr:hypothetical protein BYT27DRAFT_7182776 [Phlegmacium glaucopus]